MTYGYSAGQAHEQRLTFLSASAAPRVVPSVGQRVEQAALGELGVAHNALAFVHVSTTEVDQLHAVVASWQAGLSALPIALHAYATADITSAETYLRALKKKVQQQ